MSLNFTNKQKTIKIW